MDVRIEGALEEEQKVLQQRLHKLNAEFDQLQQWRWNHIAFEIAAELYLHKRVMMPRLLMRDEGLQHRE